MSPPHLSPPMFDLLFHLYAPTSPHSKPDNIFLTDDTVNEASDRLTSIGFLIIGTGPIHDRHLSQEGITKIDAAVYKDYHETGGSWKTLGQVKEALTRKDFHRCLQLVKLPAYAVTTIYRSTSGKMLYVVESHRGHPQPPSLLQVVDITKPISWTWRDAGVAKILLRLAIDINPVYRGFTTEMIENNVSTFLLNAILCSPERFRHEIRDSIEDGFGLVFTYSTELSSRGVPLSVSVTMNPEMMFGDIATCKDDGTRGWQGPVTARTLFREYVDTHLGHETVVVRTTGDFED